MGWKKIKAFKLDPNLIKTKFMIEKIRAVIEMKHMLELDDITARITPYEITIKRMDKNGRPI